MSTYPPLPQTLLHPTHSSTKRLTHLEAHNLLSSFLTEADTNPAYRPDSTLSQSGVSASAAGEGTGTNLTLHHLRRVLAGIEGKRVGGVEVGYGSGREGKRRKVGGDVESNPPASVSQSQRQSQRRAQQNQTSEYGELQWIHDATITNSADEAQAEAGITARETDTWQNKEDYEHAQVDETVDLDGRDPAEPDHQEDIEVTSTVGKSQSQKDIDKHARKIAKQERQKTEKQRRAEERAARKAKGED